MWSSKAMSQNLSGRVQGMRLSWHMTLAGLLATILGFCLHFEPIYLAAVLILWVVGGFHLNLLFTETSQGWTPIDWHLEAFLVHRFSEIHGSCSTSTTQASSMLQQMHWLQGSPPVVSCSPLSFSSKSLGFICPATINCVSNQKLAV